MKIRDLARGLASTSPHDARSVYLSSLIAVDEELDAGPPIRQYGDNMPRDYLGNDRVGLCTWAGPAHAIQCMAAELGISCKITQDDTEAGYRKTSGWNGKVGDPSDTGGLIVESLTEIKRSGIGDQKILDFVRVHLDTNTIQSVINAFGHLIVGCDLPKRINEKEDRDEWGIPAVTTSDDDPGSDGGHCYMYRGYNGRDIVARPWIEDVPETYPFHGLYVSEAWVVLYEPWLEMAASKNGLPYNRLMDNIRALRAAG